MFASFNDIVTVPEMCEMLRIGKNKVYEMLKNGSIYAKKSGRIYIIAKSSIIEYVIGKEHIGVS